MNHKFSMNSPIEKVTFSVLYFVVHHSSVTPPCLFTFSFNYSCLIHRFRENLRMLIVPPTYTVGPLELLHQDKTTHFSLCLNFITNCNYYYDRSMPLKSQIVDLYRLKLLYLIFIVRCIMAFVIHLYGAWLA